jgi:chromosome segregation ATPase
LFLAQSQVETLERQLEEETKAREDLEEQLDSQRMEKDFLLEQKAHLEQMLTTATEQNVASQTALKVREITSFLSFTIIRCWSAYKFTNKNR